MSLPQPEGPPGNRFAFVTPDNNSAPILVVTITTLTFTFIIFAVRVLAVKWRNWGRDDLVLSLAHIIAVIHWAGIFEGVKFGLGKSFDTLDEGQLRRMAKAVISSRMLLVIVLALSKISILLVIRFLFTWEKRQKFIIIDASIAICAIWGTAAAITLSVGCFPVGSTVKCDNQILRLQIIIILDMLIECLIVLLPVIFLWTLHISRQKKMLVIMAFGFRFPLAILSLISLISSTRFLSNKSHSGTSLAQPILWQELVIAYSLMSATIPCLKSFVQGFTHGGVGYLLNATYGDDRYQSGSGRSGHSFVMVGLKKKRSAIEAGIEIGAIDHTPQRMQSVGDTPSGGEFETLEEFEGHREFEGPGEFEAPLEFETLGEFEGHREFEGPGEFEAPLEFETLGEFEGHGEFEGPGEFEAPLEFETHGDWDSHGHGGDRIRPVV